MKNFLIVLVALGLIVLIVTFLTKDKEPEEVLTGSRGDFVNIDVNTRNGNIEADKKDNPAPINTIVKSENKTVRYTENGFSPTTLTISEGAKVTFINDSDSGMWVASDPHPSHSILPSFDSNKSLKKGESYSYTFTKKGTWGYHNHAQANRKGKIVVE